MAKTFKNLPRPSEPSDAKPLSERDFFDLNIEQTAKKIADMSNNNYTINTSNNGNTSNSNNVKNKGNTDNKRNTTRISNTDHNSNIEHTDSINNYSGNVDNTGNIDNTGNVDKSSNTGLIAGSNTLSTPLTATFENMDGASDGVRQTFVLSRGHLEQLRDYVHSRRVQGDYTYSQKQALQDALELLFASATAVPPRPPQVRAQEEQHRQRIQRGRRSNNSQ